VVIPVEAVLLQNGQSLALKRSHIGLDLDKNTYYDIVLPATFSADKAFVVKMKFGKPKGQSDQLMDEKM
jgi:alpha-L-fucosidase